MLKGVLKNGLTHFLVHAAYMAGIALLFPVLVASWEAGAAPWVAQKNKFAVSAALMLIGALVHWRHSGSLSRTVKSLGWMKIIPGIVAFAIFFFGKDYIFGQARNSITGFSFVEPLVRQVVSHSVPNLELFAAGYIILGMLFVWVGNHMENFFD